MHPVGVAVGAGRRSVDAVDVDDLAVHQGHDVEGGGELVVQRREVGTERAKQGQPGQVVPRQTGELGSQPVTR